jgi:hypothetical protein
LIDILEKADRIDTVMDIYIVIEQEWGEVFVRVFNSLELAKEYVDKMCNSHNVRVERQEINTGKNLKKY